MQDQQGESSGNPSQRLPLPATLDLLNQREIEGDELQGSLRSLQSTLSKRSRELERLENELRPLEIQQKAAILNAKEAIRRKGLGEKGMGDCLELKGKWYQTVDSLIGDALDVQV